MAENTACILARANPKLLDRFLAELSYCLHPMIGFGSIVIVSDRGALLFAMGGVGGACALLLAHRPARPRRLRVSLFAPRADEPASTVV